MDAPITDKLAEALNQLISDSGLRAIAIHGEWGVGKTHRVQKFFHTTTTRELLAKSKLGYAYASLFGASSLQQVRHRICAAALDYQGHKILKLFSKAAVLKAEVEAGGFGSIDLSAAGDLATDFVLSRVLNQLVVCIDDLERIGSNLEIRDVMGLIADLVEQRECKCVALFNANKFSEEAKRQLSSNEEKVFDLRITYSPPPEVNIHYSGIDGHDRTTAVNAFSAFGVANIRVMRRAAWALRMLRRQVGSSVVWDEIVQNATILTILKHSFAHEVPDLRGALEDQTTIGRLLFGGRPQEADKLPESIKAPLRHLGFTIQPYTLSLLQLIESGSVPSGLTAEIGTAVSEHQKSETARGVDQLFRRVRRGFACDPTLPSDLSIFLQSKAKQLTVGTLLQLLDILLALAPSQDSKELAIGLLTPHLCKIPDAPRKKMLSGFPRINALKELEELAVASSTDRTPLSDIIMKIAGRYDSWDPSYYAELASYSDTEIGHEIKAIDRNDGLDVVQRLIERLANHELETASALLPRLKSILNEIADQGPLQNLRYEDFVSDTVKRTAETVENRRARTNQQD